MTRSLMLLPVFCLLAFCGESGAPVVRVVTKEMRMNAAVHVLSQKIMDDGSVRDSRYPGLKIGDQAGNPAAKNSDPLGDFSLMFPDQISRLGSHPHQRFSRTRKTLTLRTLYLPFRRDHGHPSFQFSLTHQIGQVCGDITL